MGSLSACQTSHEVARDPLVVNPKARPVRNVSGFSEAMKCMDAMIGAYVDRDVLLIAEDIPNKSGVTGLAVSGKEMLISAISEISATSKRIRFVAYDPKETPVVVEIFAHQNKDKKEATAFRFPAFFIRGAITQVEKKVSSGGRDIGVGVPGIARIGGSKVETLSVVALDMNVGDQKTLQILPGVNSRNVLSVFKKGEAFEAMAGIISKVEVDYAMEFEQQEGMSAAIRSLIDLGTVEIVGKLLNLPYDDCLAPERRAAAVAGAMKHGPALPSDLGSQATDRTALQAPASSNPPTQPLPTSAVLPTPPGAPEGRQPASSGAASTTDAKDRQQRSDAESMPRTPSPEQPVKRSSDDPNLRFWGARDKSETKNGEDQKSGKDLNIKW